MGDNEKDLFIQNLEQMRLLTGELAELRGEMVEFKNTIKERVVTLEESSKACQITPSVCANARKLDEYLKRDAGKFSKVFMVLGFCCSIIAILISVIKL